MKNNKNDNLSLNAISRKENVKMDTINTNETFAIINEARHILETEELPQETVDVISAKTDTVLELIGPALQGDIDSINQINKLVEELNSFITDPSLSINPKDEFIYNTIKEDIVSRKRKRKPLMTSVELHSGVQKQKEEKEMNKTIKVNKELANIIAEVLEHEQMMKEEVNMEDEQVNTLNEVEFVSDLVGFHVDMLSPVQQFAVKLHGYVIVNGIVSTKEEEEEQMQKELKNLKNATKEQMDRYVSESFAEGLDTSEVISLLELKLEFFMASGNSESVIQSNYGKFGAIYINDTLIPELERFASTKEENKKKVESQERFDDMSEKLDNIKETIRKHNEKMKEERDFDFKEKIKEVTKGKSVASETDKVFQKVEEVFNKTSDSAKKSFESAKKAERKFGKFMGEFLVKSAMKGAANNRKQ